MTAAATGDPAGIAAGNSADPEAAWPTPEVSFDTAPDRYRHWRLSIDGEIATLTLSVDEDGGLVPGYQLKLNSYDLGVDIELADAVQRLRFEHPQVKAVVLTGGLDRTFCAGANIGMLARSTHSWKVNFCKFTNETRLAIEDATECSGQIYLAAVNGTAAGGGYELALACEEIVLVDDGSAAVSLPEVSMLGVLPGTGGLTRVVDKRHVRKDLADVFATRRDGVRGRTALAWGLVDATVPRGQFAAAVFERAGAAAARSPRRARPPGVSLPPLARTTNADTITYPWVEATLARSARRVDITLIAPDAPPPPDPAAVLAEGAGYWPLALTRALDDLVLRLRCNELELGSWVFRTRGDAATVLGYDRQLAQWAGDWFIAEVRAYLKRTLKRLDVTSRSLIAVVEPGSCFAGPLLEVALACDRQYMLDGTFEGDGTGPATLVVGEANRAGYPMGNGLTRLESRFYGWPNRLRAVHDRIGEPLDAAAVRELGLVTLTPDDLDWDDEVRIALEERAGASPDALSGMEANHRFVGPETVETKIFGRLTAWQNWIFNRPNASGPDGALRRYGTGRRAEYDLRRV